MVLQEDKDHRELEVKQVQQALKVLKVTKVTQVQKETTVKTESFQMTSLKSPTSTTIRWICTKTQALKKAPWSVF